MYNGAEKNLCNTKFSLSCHQVLRLMQFSDQQLCTVHSLWSCNDSAPCQLAYSIVHIMFKSGALMQCEYLKNVGVFSKHHTRVSKRIRVMKCRFQHTYLVLLCRVLASVVIYLLYFLLCQMFWNKNLLQILILSFYWTPKQNYLSKMNI